MTSVTIDYLVIKNITKTILMCTIKQCYRIYMYIYMNENCQIIILCNAYFVCMIVCMYVCMYVYVYDCMYVCMYVCICMYMCMYV